MKKKRRKIKTMPIRELEQRMARAARKAKSLPRAKSKRR